MGNGVAGCARAGAVCGPATESIVLKELAPDDGGVPMKAENSPELDIEVFCSGTCRLSRPGGVQMLKDCWQTILADLLGPRNPPVECIAALIIPVLASKARVTCASFLVRGLVRLLVRRGVRSTRLLFA